MIVKVFFIIYFHVVLASEHVYDLSQPYAYYDVLGIPKTSKVRDIKSAYFRLAKKYHPDMQTLSESDAKAKKDEKKKDEMRRKFDVG